MKTFYDIIVYIYITMCLTFTVAAACAETVNYLRMFDQSNFPEAQHIIILLEQSEEEIDFAVAKLKIDKLVDPSIDIEADLKKIDAIVRSIQSMLPVNASGADKLLIIKKYLYKAGVWNKYQPYQYDFSDPKGTKILNKLLTTYLNRKKGNCISMPFLFLIIGQRLGIDVAASTAPLHVLVKYTNSETGQTVNLETTSGAGLSRDIWYQQNMHITKLAMANKIYLQKLSKRETVAVMAILLAEHYSHVQEYVKAMMICDVVLKYYKKSVESMVMKGTLFYYLLNKHYLSKYPPPYLIPKDEIPYYRFLDTNNRYWFYRAETFGWRVPSPENEQNYLKDVGRDAKQFQ